MENQKMLRPCEVAKRLGVSVGMVRRMALAGTIPTIRVTDKCYRYDAAAVEQFVAARMTGNATA